MSPRRAPRRGRQTPRIAARSAAVLAAQPDRPGSDDQDVGIDGGTLHRDSSLPTGAVRLSSPRPDPSCTRRWPLAVPSASSRARAMHSCSRHCLDAPRPPRDPSSSSPRPATGQRSRRPSCATAKAVSMWTRDSDRWAEPSKWSGAIRARGHASAATTASAAVNVRCAGPTSGTRAAPRRRDERGARVPRDYAACDLQVDTFRPGPRRNVEGDSSR